MKRNILLFVVFLFSTVFAIAQAHRYDIFGHRLVLPHATAGLGDMGCRLGQPCASNHRWTFACGFYPECKVATQTARSARFTRTDLAHRPHDHRGRRSAGDLPANALPTVASRKKTMAWHAGRHWMYSCAIK